MPAKMECVCVPGAQRESALAPSFMSASPMRGIGQCYPRTPTLLGGDRRHPTLARTRTVLDLVHVWAGLMEFKIKYASQLRVRRCASFRITIFEAKVKHVGVLRFALGLHRAASKHPHTHARTHARTHAHAHVRTDKAE